jgi:hypothetical protein
MPGSSPSRSPTPAQPRAPSTWSSATCPFGKISLADRRHNPAGHSIHDHFIVKGLHLLRPGG